MTMPNERLRALKQTARLLEELCDPGKTPRVPGAVRDRARRALKHYPLDGQIDKMAESCPDILGTDKKPDKLTFNI
jgi:hypothetical protein